MEDDSLLDAFGIETLDKMRVHYETRKDYQMMERVRSAINRKGNVQTPELSNCGRLFKHRHYDEETGRVTHSWTGDNMAWMQHFMSNGAVGRIDAGLCTGKNSEVGKAWQAKRKAALEAAGL